MERKCMGLWGSAEPSFGAVADISGLLSEEGLK